MNKSSSFTWKLGMFVITGLAAFIVTVYFVGKKKNLFGSTFTLKTKFKTVSGLKLGNNVRFSGINIGTVNEIEIVNDTTVIVDLIIKKDMQQFIKKDAIASIGSEGLMGDKVLSISPGTFAKASVKDEDFIASKNAVEMEDIMVSVKTSVDNIGVVSSQLALFTSRMNNSTGTLSRLLFDEEFSGTLKNALTNIETSSDQFAKFTTSMNNGKGALSKLVTDEKFGSKLDSTMSNLEAGSKGINETIEAAQHNFLLRGFFNKKKRAEAKKLEEQKKMEEKRKKEEMKQLKKNSKKNDGENLPANLNDSTKNN